MSDVAAPIVLAHEPPFALGRLTVRPSTREVARDDGAIEVLEPRVMQVLVALHRAGGGIVARDDLTHSCWEGRVVGEDAINRVISRLRRTAGGIGEGAVRVETVTKVGYRLVGATAASRASIGSATADAGQPSRRGLLGIGVGAAALAGGAGWWWMHRNGAQEARLPSEVGALMEQAKMAMRQASPEGNAQAIGIYRRVVDIAPGYADGWGALALAYSSAVHVRPVAFVGDMTARARDAAERALAIDPDNNYARLARIGMLPHMGNWLERERVGRAAVRAHPDVEAGLLTYAGLLSMVGRNRDAVPFLDHCLAIAGPSPGLCYGRAVTLWAAGRLEDGDRAVGAAFALYPTHYAVWFTRFYMLAYTGRAMEAVAFAQDRAGRPSGIPEDNFDLVVVQGRALQTRAAADIDAAMRQLYAAAREGAGNAENAIGFAASTGRLDDAFAFTDAYYFGRGFEVGEVRFSPVQGLYTRRSDRRTLKLFQPPAAAMWRDPRFATLMDELKLTEFWRASGVKPDYQRA